MATDELAGPCPSLASVSSSAAWSDALRPAGHDLDRQVPLYHIICSFDKILVNRYWLENHQPLGDLGQVIHPCGVCGWGQHCVLSHRVLVGSGRHHPAKPSAWCPAQGKSSKLTEGLKALKVGSRLPHKAFGQLLFLASGIQSLLLLVSAPAFLWRELLPTPFPLITLSREP